MKLKPVVFCLSVLFCTMILFLSCSTQTSSRDELFPEDHDQKLEWWKDARFGMFIHWGPVSIKGTEIGWSRGTSIPIEEYDNLYKQFNPVHFDADEWVSIAKEAGMKYIVFTSKHHDGFCNWDTEYTDYNIMNSPFKRDVMAELSAACKKQGIALCFYHSTCDWHHPDFPLTSPGGSVEREVYNLDRYTEYLKNQSVEILQNYGPLLVMWYDVPQRFDSIRGQGVIDHIREIQPGVLVNNRTGAKGDFDTPEQRVGSFQNDRPWETCMTIANQWAWKPDDNVKSLDQCLHSLIRSAGGDGNLLFNVGPKPDGRIEPLQVERLKEMGEWLKTYGYSIYGTRGGPFKPTDWGVSTRKENSIYLHLINWMGNAPEIIIPDIGMKIISCKLTDGSELTLKKREGGYSVQIPGDLLQPINTVIELVADGNVMEIQPMEIPSQSRSFKREVKASSNPNPHWGDVSNINNGDWFGHPWRPAEDDENPWVEIDFGKPEEISKAIIYEQGEKIESFVMQYFSDGKWVKLFEGEKIGSKAEFEFNPVETQQVRMVINEFTKGLNLYEIIIL